MLDSTVYSICHYQELTEGSLSCILCYQNYLAFSPCNRYIVKNVAFYLQSFCSHTAANLAYKQRGPNDNTKCN